MPRASTATRRRPREHRGVANRGGRDRVLDQQRAVGNDVLERLALLLGKDRLVLVADENVTLAGLQEGVQSIAGAGVPDDHARGQLLEELDGLVLGLAGIDLGLVGGEDVPLGAARRDRVGGDDRDVFADQVVPRLDVLGIAGPDIEHDDAVVDDAAVLVIGPILCHDARLDQSLDVRRQGECQHVSGQSGLDGTALVA